MKSWRRCVTVPMFLFAPFFFFFFHLQIYIDWDGVIAVGRSRLDQPHCTGGSNTIKETSQDTTTTTTTSCTFCWATPMSKTLHTVCHRCSSFLSFCLFHFIYSLVVVVEDFFFSFLTFYAGNPLLLSLGRSLLSHSLLSPFLPMSTLMTIASTAPYL